MPLARIIHEAIAPADGSPFAGASRPVVEDGLRLPRRIDFFAASCESSICSPSDFLESKEANRIVQSR